MSCRTFSQDVDSGHSSPSYDMVPPKILLYFDLHSPFSYLAFHVVRVRDSPIPIILLEHPKH